jgi:hypothetical protein
MENAQRSHTNGCPLHLGKRGKSWFPARRFLLFLLVALVVPGDRRSDFSSEAVS